MKISGIYQIRHKASGRVYVGSSHHIYSRWSVHIFHLRHGSHHNRKLQNAWKKYGEDSFVFEVLEKITDKDTRTNRETVLIHELDGYGEGYNLLPVANSCLGVKRSKEFCAKAKKHMAKLCKDPEELKRRSERAVRMHKNGELGYCRWSEEAKRSCRKLLSKRFKGKSLSEDHRKKLSEGQLRRFKDPEQRKKRSIATLLGIRRRDYALKRTIHK